MSQRSVCVIGVMQMVYVAQDRAEAYYRATRFEPNRVAAGMEGNGEFDF